MRPSTIGRLPNYCTPVPSRDSLSLVPPFSFSGVTARVFPLRASVNALQHFCNRYLNIIPPEVGHFQATGPYVNLMLINYGRMAVDVANVGWLAQREIAFCIPLEWYRRVNGRWVFHDWAMICPFIFVDSDMSMSVGRTVYGWPKAYATLKATEGPWMEDPTASLFDATVSTMVFSGLYRNQKLKEETFLQIEHEAPTSNARLPFDPRGTMAPWMVASRMAESVVGFGRDYVSLLAGLGVMPRNAGGSPDNLMARLSRIAQWRFPLAPDGLCNTLNLKQFRGSDTPDRYTYQAVTNGPMRYSAWNRVGLLGEQGVMTGDASGGFSVRLHRWASLPIVETLGLEIHSRWNGPGCEVVQLKPVLPYWCDVDMDYLPGSDVAWRIDDATWHDPSGRSYPPRMVGDEVARDETLFNTTLGAFDKAVAGPFRYSDTTIRVMPLLAERKAVKALVDRYMNDPLDDDERFTLWGPPGDHVYVYMTATVYGDVSSSTNDIGDWADGEVAFLIPVHRSSKGKPVGVGLLPAFVYSDGATAAASGVEVLGLPVWPAKFNRPESIWMTRLEPGKEAYQTLLRVHASVLPVLGEGQEAEMRPIIEIEAGEPLDAQKDRDMVGFWTQTLKRELERKNDTKDRHAGLFRESLALALGILGDDVPVALYTLKQIRDTADPNRAAYQSLVRIRRWLRRNLDIREIEMPLTVRLHNSPSHPLFSALGLVGRRLPPGVTGTRYELMPIRPFWINLTMNEGAGTRLRERVRGGPWRSPATLDLREEEESRDALIKVGRALVDMADQGNPTDLTRLFQNWSERPRGNLGIMPMVALTALDEVDPQTIIEAILSREWGNRDGRARWQVTRSIIVELLKERLSYTALTELQEASDSFYLAQLGRLPEAYRALAGDMIKNLRVMYTTVMNLYEAMEGRNDDLFAEELAMFAAFEVLGEATYPQEVSATAARIVVLATRLKETRPEVQSDDGRAVEALGKAMIYHQTDALNNFLAKANQKPDFVVRRDWVRPREDRDRLFPLELSLKDDDRWYSGRLDTRTITGSQASPDVPGIAP